MQGNKKDSIEKQQNENIEESIKVLIVGRIYEQDETFKITKKIIKNFTIHASSQFYFMTSHTSKKVCQIFPNLQCFIFESQIHSKTLDYVVTIGGDGTILYAAKQFNDAKQTPPFLVFQKGTLGFMCQFSLQQIQQVIQKAVKIFKQKPDKQLFQTKKMMRLGASLTKKIQKQSQQQKQEVINKICVNEVSITRNHCQKISLRIYIDGKFLTQTIGDGLLISTPTGSTAYALSAGGPIISNGVNCIEIVPIAPYSLSFRPICLPSSSEIMIQIAQDSKSSAIISFDGQSSAQFQKQEILIINKSTSDIVFFSPLKQQDAYLPQWMQRLQLFLRWNEGFKAAECELQERGLKKISNKTASLNQYYLLDKEKNYTQKQVKFMKGVNYKSSVQNP